VCHMMYTFWRDPIYNIVTLPKDSANHGRTDMMDHAEKVEWSLGVVIDIAHESPDTQGTILGGLPGLERL
jgi:hypothetical protein